MECSNSCFSALRCPSSGLCRDAWFYFRRMENSEKLSMIEKGVDPSLFRQKKKRLPPEPAPDFIAI
jgi:hypothetical protein